MNSKIANTLIWGTLVFMVGCSTPEPQPPGEPLATNPVGGNAQVGRVPTQVPNTPVSRNEQREDENFAVGATMDRVREADTVQEVIVAPSSVMHYKMAAEQDMGMVSIRPASEPLDRENYAHFDDNPVKRVLEHPVSTFSIDVDTGSYAVIRRMLNNGQLPRKDAVRSEELINYFSYEYPETAQRSAPFAVHKEIAPTPWNANTHLLHIGIKGFEQDRSSLPSANLVFLVDVSGSMQDANKLGLLKSSLKLLARQLRSEDTVAIVVYAGASGVVLEPTAGNNRAKIVTALDRLQAGGSTNGAAGIRLAYTLAEQSYIKGGINRVLLATDGDFNVGTVDLEQLKDLVEEKRKSGIALSTLGFGAGNYNDALMEQIADIGNGNYSYIDTLSEARKVLVDEMGSTMLTIAKDVKIQIEFNPALVAEYRLIGYENRALNREDFNNDKVDAGEIGAGHTVTALYEVALTGSAGLKMDALRYQPEQQEYANGNEIAFLRLRYKAPESDRSQLLEWTIARDEMQTELSDTSTDFQFAAAVAAFGQMLRGGEHLDGYEYQDILELARTARGRDPFGHRGEFLSLVQLADAMTTLSPDEPQRLGLME
jgi:Ca-activated chloride channel family protein